MGQFQEEEIRKQQNKNLIKASIVHRIVSDPRNSAMEEEKNETKKDSLAPKLNVLERLIKLDRKNSSLTLLDKEHNKKLMIRHQNLGPGLQWAGNQTEQNLRHFWKHVNDFYFKKVDESDMIRLDYASQLINPPIKDIEEKYANPEAYDTFKRIINPEYKKLLPDPRLAKINLQNLQKSFLLQTLKNSSIPKPQTPVKIQKAQKQLQDIKSRPKQPKVDKAKKLLKTYLNEEAEQLEEVLETLGLGQNSEKPELTKELEKLVEEEEELNELNMNALVHVREFAEKEQLSSNLLTYDKNPDEGMALNKEYEKILRHKKRNIQLSETIDTQIKYLQSLIVRLEDMQAAESIKYVVDVTKPNDSNGKYKFCVIFDEAICQKEAWVEENILDQLEKLREQSLFKVYNIPQKLQHSMNTSNIMGFHYCQLKFQTKTFQLKERPWKDLMKKRINDVFDGFKKEDAFLKSRQYGLCHHCRYLFPNEYLISCNYTSARMGLPIMSSFSDPLSDGDLVCLRKFCRACLKQNYDLTVAEITGKTDWICPFCSGNCYCSRCLRNDHLSKLMSLFMMLGGDIHEINKESCLQKFVLHQDPDEILRQNKSPQKMLSYYALKPTPGRKPKLVSTDVKIKVRKYRESLKKYQFFKNLRIHMEKVRLLCSQVSKRENLKIKLEILEKDIIQQRLDDGEISGKKRRGGRALFIEHEPLITKKTRENGVTSRRSTQKIEIEDEVVDSDILDEDEEEFSENGEISELEEEEDIEDVLEDEEEEEEEDEEMEEEEVKVDVPKRKRGRPPKNKPKEELIQLKSHLKKITAPIPQSDETVQTPRKRGRPPKNPPPVSPSRPNSTSQRGPQPASGQQPLVDVPKRKRGRPRLSEKRPDEKDKKNPSTSPGAIRPTGQLKPRHPVLKKELQKILAHQSWDMLSSVGSSRATRHNNIGNDSGKKK